MKKLKINLLAIIGMMVAVGTLAFTAPKENAAQWYEVTVDEDFPNDESLQLITGTTSEPAPSDDCQEQVSGIICKVQLDLHPNTPLPATMEDARLAESNDDLSIEAEAKRFQ